MCPAQCLPLPCPLPIPLLPPNSPREGPGAVCVLFPFPNSNQGLIGSCSPVENFLWVWVTRRKRNTHTASENFPSIKVNESHAQWRHCLSKFLSSNRKLWGNVYTSETLLNFLFNQCLKSYNVCLLLKFTTKLQYLSFWVTRVWFCPSSRDSLRPGLFALGNCGGWGGGGEETYPVEISEFKVPIFSNEFLKGKQTFETLILNKREHNGTEAVICKLWSEIFLFPLTVQ